jgi:hypothetical protein
MTLSLGVPGFTEVRSQIPDGYPPGGIGCVEPKPLGAIAPCPQLAKATSTLHVSANLNAGSVPLFDSTNNSFAVISSLPGSVFDSRGAEHS